MHLRDACVVDTVVAESGAAVATAVLRLSGISFDASSLIGVIVVRVSRSKRARSVHALLCSMSVQSLSVGQG